MTQEILLNDEIIYKVKTESISLVKNLMEQDLVKMILYGSCARGDYTTDSDIDIALITRCDRMEAKKYGDVLADAATKLAMKYFAIVNFVCIPYAEFIEKKNWYPYFHNISVEGEVLYG